MASPRLGIHVSKTWVMDHPKEFNPCQFYCGSPKKWEVDLNLSADDAVGFKDVDVVIHGPYVHHALPSEKNREKNMLFLPVALGWCDRHGFGYYVVHLGPAKYKGNSSIRAAMKPLMPKADEFIAMVNNIGPNCMVLVENTASIPGGLMFDLYRRFAHGGPKVSVCIDIAHCWGAGWTMEKMAEMINELRPPVIHLNSPIFKYFEDGKDRHGWWHHGHMTYLLKHIWEEAIKHYDPILILEGSSLEGSMLDEIEFVKKILV